MKFRWWTLAGLALVMLLVAPQSGDSCGPFLVEMQFTTYHGVLPGEFSSGHPGVLRPHFWRKDLLIAYRTLSGVPLAASEEPEVRPTAASARAPAEPWLAARREVPGVAKVDQVETDRSTGQPYEFFSNCLSSAFETAAATLHRRIEQWGLASPQVAEWVRGQDMVFRNCSSAVTIPPELTAADPAPAADRRYQIAAAKFYAGQYQQAETDFDRIAADAASPWHEIAPYLAARACIRQGTITDDQAKLVRAAERLRAVIADPARPAQHKPARDLLGFVQARLEPQHRLTELGEQIMKPNLGSDLSNIVTDYTRIWDRLEEASKPAPREDSDVADWIATFQHGGPAVERWRARHTLPWLVAALVWADAKDTAWPDLLAAAHAVPADSPAYASVSYYGILRLIRSGGLDAARRWTDEALSRTPSLAAVNMLRSERFRLARDWDEFLRFATRKPVSISDMDGDSPISADDARKHPLAFDGDAAQTLNVATPLRLWLDASKSASVPAGLRARIAQAAWVRAVILDDRASAIAMADRVAVVKPELRDDMRVYAAEKDPAAAHFTAIFLMLRFPGFEPVLRAGLGRETPVKQSDSFRDNWWDLIPTRGVVQPDQADHEALYDLYPDGKFVTPDFLPKDQRAAGETEWHKLIDRAGNAVNYLCAEAIVWARAHPQDPRVPQALHQAVESTHYGPADKASTAFSREAFELLHRRYPNSPWTAKTKYWY